ncbi:ribosome biogenesis GTP-binding protein YihA/YsxC [Collinsella sp. AGMB00827]|uniref:Probable GTP-binding protein EngB n=1 Tax=Collinsella ureilytica TaxID=2869515 RepID=A0ABS7MIX2_9ACTN|nr:ribosome biogenesis GTP-binding protein YihA/YsxC [Collinsella urealyticum]MBY4797263.1 ribosome biogenesis GTP-binding protein YihA/YsxC [Collinsella urealyticum]
MAGQINYQLARFVASYGDASKIPASTCPEVSFVGRSNVGKSSIMNKLFNRKNLVKVSSTPGKTANVNFFEADGIHFVDLPGYGYAQRSKAERDRWKDLIGEFFELDRSFNLVVSLIDIRHEPSALDHQMIDYLNASGLPFVIALTKADKLSRGRADQQRSAIARILGMRPADLLITSSDNGQGIDELKEIIELHCLGQE